MRDFSEPVSKMLRTTQEKYRRRLQELDVEFHTRLRILAALPPDLEVCWVHPHPLFGRLGTVVTPLDGEAAEVTASLHKLFEELPPVPAERAKDSCQWIQHRGYVRPDVDDARVEKLPICPVWVNFIHTVGGNSELIFHWYTKTSDGPDQLLMGIDAKVTRVSDWARIAYDVGHSPGETSVSISRQELQTRFRGMRIWYHGGSIRSTKDATLYWDDGVPVGDILAVDDEWFSHRANF